MTHPSSAPAPMTAKRLADIRAESLERVVALAPSEAARLFAHIDALTARVAELEREVAELDRAGAEAVSLSTDWEMRAIRAEAKLESARRDALEKAALLLDEKMGKPFGDEIRALQTKDTTP